MKILSLTLLLLSWAAYSEDCTGEGLKGCEGGSSRSNLGQRDDITCCQSSCYNGSRKTKDGDTKTDSTSATEVLD